MVSKTPFRHDRATARDDARNAISGQWYVTEQDACMDGEVIHALLSLLD